eukprot:11178816-Lingulodinium_polyedra.AAC.1
MGGPSRGRGQSFGVCVALPSRIFILAFGVRSGIASQILATAALASAFAICDCEMGEFQQSDFFYFGVGASRGLLMAWVFSKSASPASSQRRGHLEGAAT